MPTLRLFQTAAGKHLLDTVGMDKFQVPVGEKMMTVSEKVKCFCECPSSNTSGFQSSARKFALCLGLITTIMISLERMPQTRLWWQCFWTLQNGLVENHATRPENCGDTSGKCSETFFNKMCFADTAYDRSFVMAVVDSKCTWQNHEQQSTKPRQ